jgi:hypothetical protein
MHFSTLHLLRLNIFLALLFVEAAFIGEEKNGSMHASTQDNGSGSALFDVISASRYIICEEMQTHNRDVECTGPGFNWGIALLAPLRQRNSIISSLAQ